MVREWWRQRIQVLGIETDELLAIERQATPLTPFSRKESQELSESGPLPNGSRLSCGAPKKESSFNILRAPAAPSAC